ncbi:hypothetical protein E2C01_017402 [Portunus trituberculatus]|uniref:Uncharacterized protein n=1 Tax=Portunus trituberculatus TaxID=210409 RepID=A0A5B7DRS5_PORTR|nr:hypothetical protein [Portunus trituberculatus]
MSVFTPTILHVSSRARQQQVYSLLPLTSRMIQLTGVCGSVTCNISACMTDITCVTYVFVAPMFFTPSMARVSCAQLVPGCVHVSHQGGDNEFDLYTVPLKCYRLITTALIFLSPFCQCYLLFPQQYNS